MVRRELAFPGLGDGAVLKDAESALQKNIIDRLIAGFAGAEPVEGAVGSVMRHLADGSAIGEVQRVRGVEEHANRLVGGFAIEIAREYRASWAGDLFHLF